MKLYSRAYQDTMLSLHELNEAKAALVNQDGQKLHALINSEAQKSGHKPINRLKEAVGAKVSTPVNIRALSDFYQTSHFIDPQGNRLMVPEASTPWEAARFFADHRSFLSVPVERTKFANRSSRSSSISLNTSPTPSSSRQLSRNSTLQWSPIDEEIPSYRWQLSEKKRSQLKPLSFLKNEGKLKYQAQAAKVHRAKVDHVDDVRNFANLKFVI